MAKGGAVGSKAKGMKGETGDAHWRALKVLTRQPMQMQREGETGMADGGIASLAMAAGYQQSHRGCARQAPRLRI